MIWTFGIFLIAGALLSSCSQKTVTTAALEIVVSGDTDGWITPCGCTTNQSGGLLRRATYLKELGKKNAVIYADVGGAAAGTSAYQRLLFEAILRGEKAIDVVAHNIGGPEAALGVDRLREIQRRTGIPFISANLRDAEGREVLPALMIVPSGGRRIGFVGVLSPRFADKTIRVMDPLQSIRDVIDAKKSDFDALVILAYLPDEELQQLATNLPEADAVIGGPTGQSIAPRPVGPTVLAAATRKGKFLVHLQIPAARSGPWTGEIVELGPAYGDDSVQHKNVLDYLAALRSADFASISTGLAPMRGEGGTLSIAGSASCIRCHKSDGEIWAHSAHGHAWQTLVSKGYEVDPSCQVCHTTGYGMSGGFVSAKRASSVDVGCEDCHGLSEAHAADPKSRTLYRAMDQCSRCHDAENSPTFQLASFWKKVAHGSQPQLPQGEAR